jgi:SM-20-related protein
MDRFFDLLLESVSDKGYFSSDRFISQTAVTSLLAQGRDAENNGLFKPAGIGKGSAHFLSSDIRSDTILWLTDDRIRNWCPELYERLMQLIKYLNEDCYAGIKEWEFHLAHYAPGAYYKRHLDRFKTDNGRLFTFILYLNEDWKENDGGQLLIYPPAGSLKIMPEAGRMVFFPSSDLPHEVLPSLRHRWSFTGWLKSSSGVF